MLAALIASQNSHRATAAATARKSAGHSTSRPRPASPTPPVSSPAWANHDFGDIVAAAATFPEIAGEDPIARIQRRLRWTEEVLPYIKETREKREALTFLAGAQLADAAAQERLAAREQELAAKEEALARAQSNQRSAKARAERTKSTGIGAAIAISFVAGAVIGATLVRRRRVRKR